MNKKERKIYTLELKLQSYKETVTYVVTVSYDLLDYCDNKLNSKD